VQNELLGPDLHRVPRIRSALVPGDDVRFRGQDVHNLPLALIAPLGTHHDDAIVSVHRYPDSKRKPGARRARTAGITRGADGMMPPAPGSRWFGTLALRAAGRNPRGPEATSHRPASTDRRPGSQRAQRTGHERG